MTALLPRRFLLALPAASWWWTSALAGPSPTPPGAELYFITPHEGERLRSPILCRFGLSGTGSLLPACERAIPGIITC